jgi:hypothetical protein
MTFCYSGKSPRLWNSELDETGLLFELGSWEFLDRDTAITSTRGAQEKAYLVKDEWMSCVVGDGQSDYLDNSGEIILDVYYSLR